MRAVGYFRPASEPGGADEAEGALSGQASASGAIERYCRENFHQLVRVVEASRPTGSYDELVGFFRGTQTAALVLIPDSTHLADDLPTLVERLIELEEAGGEVRCVDPDLPDPLQSGLASLGLRGRASERLRRVREAIGAKAVRGEVLGRTPYGYGAGLDGRLTPHPDEAETVERIFRWYAGDADEGVGDEAAGERPVYTGPGLRRIAARLNEEDVRTRSGNAWTPVAVAGILRNRVYVGTYSRMGLRLVGTHAGLVDRTLFNRAQEIVRQRRPRRRRARPGRYLLGGLLRCGVCGRGVFGLTRRRMWRRKDGTEVSRAYRYYECPARAVRSRGAGEEHPSWRAERLEEAVLAKVTAWARSVPEGAWVAVRESGSSVKRRGAAERLFMRSLRDVASGAGALRDLAEPLARMRQGGVDSGAALNEEFQGVGELVGVVRGDNEEAAARALAALVERVVVRSDSVDVAMCR